MLNPDLAEERNLSIERFAPVVEAARAKGIVTRGAIPCLDASKCISDFPQRRPNSRAATAILNKRAG